MNLLNADSRLEALIREANTPEECQRVVKLLKDQVRNDKVETLFNCRCYYFPNHWMGMDQPQDNMSISSGMAMI